MKAHINTFRFLSVATLSTLLLAGCTTAHHPAPGQYETKTEKVDADGTVHKSTSSTDIYYDKNGKMRGTVDKETTTDPKGLFNKSTTESHKTIK